MYTNPSITEALARPSLDGGLSNSNTAQRQNPNNLAGSLTPPKPLRASTEAAYAKDLRLFLAAGGTVPCDVAALHRYLAKMGKRLSPTTLHRRLMAVRYGHISRGYLSPTDDPLMRATMRTLQAGYLPGKIPAVSLVQSGNQNLRRKAPESAKPITRATFLRMLDAMHRSMLDYRDRAMLLLGFAAALSRSELIGIDVSDIRFMQDAMLVAIRTRDEAAPSADDTGTS